MTGRILVGLNDEIWQNVVGIVVNPDRILVPFVDYVACRVCIFKNSQINSVQYSEIIDIIRMSISQMGPIQHTVAEGSQRKCFFF